jgi:hypothetical protein
MRGRHLERLAGHMRILRSCFGFQILGQGADPKTGAFRLSCKALAFLCQTANVSGSFLPSLNSFFNRAYSSWRYHAMPVARAMEEVIRSSAMYNAVFSRGPNAQRAAVT